MTPAQEDAAILAQWFGEDCPTCQHDKERYGATPVYCHSCGTDRSHNSLLWRAIVARRLLDLPEDFYLRQEQRWADEDDEHPPEISALLDEEEDQIERLPPMPFYPPDWRDISRRICLSAGWHCEHCDEEFNPATRRALTKRNADGSPSILTVHHIDGDTRHNDWTNLVALCQACHLHVQAVWKPGGVLPAHWPQPPAWIAIRDLPYRKNGQLPLFPEENP